VRHLEITVARKGLEAPAGEGAFLGCFELVGEPNQRRLSELSVFPEDNAYPAAGALWGLNGFNTKDAAIEIPASSLLRIDLQKATVTLPDVGRSWSQNARSVDAWPNWNQLPDSYAWR
jgi:hypothetical protein